MIKNNIQLKQPELELSIFGKNQYVEIGNSILKATDLIEQDYCHVEYIMDSYKENPIVKIMNENDVDYLYDGVSNKNNGLCLFCPEGFKNDLTKEDVVKFKDYLCKKHSDVVVLGSEFNEIFDFIKHRPAIKEKLEILKSAQIVYAVENEYLYLAGRENINYCFVGNGKNDDWKRFFKNHNQIKL